MSSIDVKQHSILIVVPEDCHRISDKNSMLSFQTIDSPFNDELFESSYAVCASCGVEGHTLCRRPTFGIPDE